MTALTLQTLDRYGPERCDSLSLEASRAYCRKLCYGHYENFSVLSAIVPSDLRDDFAAVYAFCRWADDLGDEAGSPDRSLELLHWWRNELTECFSGKPRHPVFVALRPVIVKHDLPMDLFERLIRAFELDQTITRYDTWEQLIGYCRLSADPVGRLVLMVCGEARSDKLFELSDATCTALQLTNHWQDVRRDILERNRMYLPREMIQVENFESRLIVSARQGYGVDRDFLNQSVGILRTCVERTWPLYERGEALLNLVGPGTMPIVWLLAAGGQHVLRMIELWNYETALHRPKLGKLSRLMLVARAWLMTRRSHGVKAAA